MCSVQNFSELQAAVASASASEDIGPGEHGWTCRPVQAEGVYFFLNHGSPTPQPHPTLTASAIPTLLLSLSGALEAGELSSCPRIEAFACLQPCPHMQVASCLRGWKIPFKVHHILPVLDDSVSPGS